MKAEHDQAGGRLHRRADRAPGPPHGPRRRDHLAARRARRRRRSRRSRTNGIGVAAPPVDVVGFDPGPPSARRKPRAGDAASTDVPAARARHRPAGGGYLPRGGPGARPAAGGDGGAGAPGAARARSPTRTASATWSTWATGCSCRISGPTRWTSSSWRSASHRRRCARRPACPKRRSRWWCWSSRRPPRRTATSRWSRRSRVRSATEAVVDALVLARTPEEVLAIPEIRGPHGPARLTRARHHDPARVPGLSGHARERAPGDDEPPRPEGGPGRGGEAGGARRGHRPRPAPLPPPRDRPARHRRAGRRTRAGALDPRHPGTRDHVALRPLRLGGPGDRRAGLDHGQQGRGAATRRGRGAA